ncbi:MAG: type VI protein secretion system component VasK [Halioglobus sp.]
MRLFQRFSIFLTLMVLAPFASAYIGPGSGISVVGSLLGLLVTILLAFGAVLLWPYRRMMKKRLQKAEDEEGSLDSEPEVEMVESEVGKK